MHILLKLLLPLFLCLLNVYLSKENNYIFFVLFVIITVIFNLKKSKYNTIKTFIYAFLISFLVISISIVSYFITGYFIDLFTDNENITVINFNIQLVDLSYLFQISLVSSILFIYCYKFIFKIRFTFFTYLIIFTNILLLIILGIDEIKHGKRYLFGILEFWQIIVVFALQLILYQNELKSLLKSKNAT